MAGAAEDGDGLAFVRTHKELRPHVPIRANRRSRRVSGRSGRASWSVDGRVSVWAYVASDRPTTAAPMPPVVTPPVRIPAPGQKTIEEHVGRVATETASVSVAHMVAPPGWSEPPQTPAFDEVTIVLRGTMRVEHDGGAVDVGPGETVLCRAGERVRYLNASASAECEYWAVCVPAFSPDAARREEG